MYWALISALPPVIGMAVGAIAAGMKGFGMGVVACALWQIVVWLFVYPEFVDGYRAWRKDGMRGDHAWYEWQLCVDHWTDAKFHYDPATYCKMRLGRFKKFFSVNPDRYSLRDGYVVRDDGRPQDLIILFPRRDLFGYYRFRRQWVQSRRLVDMAGYVQADIEAADKEAKKQLDEVRGLMGKASAGFTAPWDSGAAGSDRP